MNAGGPAFPNGPCVGFTDDSQYGERGMTLRDYFAGKILTGLMAGSSCPEGRAKQLAEKVAELAYVFSDAMLAERKKFYDLKKETES